MPRSLVPVLVLAAAGCGREPAPAPAREEVPEESAASDPAESEPEEDPTLRAVAELWNERCASCHGPEGRGDGPLKPAGANVPDMTTAEFRDRLTDEQIRLQIMNGKDPMPAFRDRIPPEGITALVEHIRSLGPP